MSLSGSLTAKGIVWVHPSCKRRTGEVTARGDEFTSPVSALTVREKVVDIFQLLLKGCIQQQLVKPIVNMLLTVVGKL